MVHAELFRTLTIAAIAGLSLTMAGCGGDGDDESGAPESNATDLADMRSRLKRNKVEYRERTVPDLGLHQVFFEDPSGVTIELNFPAAEAASKG